jgi:hypothetical protein
LLGNIGLLLGNIALSLPDDIGLLLGGISRLEFCLHGQHGEAKSEEQANSCHKGAEKQQDPPQLALSSDLH